MSRKIMSPVEIVLAEIADEERYHDVVRLTLDGESARAIAEALGITERSVCRIRARARRRGVDLDISSGSLRRYKRLRRAS